MNVREGVIRAQVEKEILKNRHIDQDILDIDEIDS